MGKGSAAAFRLLRSQCSAPGRARDRTKPSEAAAFAGGKSSTALFCLPVSSIAWREERGLWARGQGCCFASESWTSTSEGEQPGPGKELLKNTAQNQLKRRVPADQSLKYLSTESALTASSTLNCSIHWQWLWSSREQSQMRCWMGLILPHQWPPVTSWCLCFSKQGHSRFGGALIKPRFHWRCPEFLPGLFDWTECEALSQLWICWCSVQPEMLDLSTPGENEAQSFLKVSDFPHHTQTHTLACLQTLQLTTTQWI